MVRPSHFTPEQKDAQERIRLTESLVKQTEQYRRYCILGKHELSLKSLVRATFYPKVFDPKAITEDSPSEAVGDALLVYESAANKTPCYHLVYAQPTENGKIPVKLAVRQEGVITQYNQATRLSHPVNLMEVVLDLSGNNPAYLAIEGNGTEPGGLYKYDVLPGPDLSVTSVTKTDLDTLVAAVNVLTDFNSAYLAYTKPNTGFLTLK